MAARKNPPAADAGETPSFEQSLERLETIVDQLEGGSLTLEESITRYEEGVTLSRRLGQTLDEAERRIERLVAGESGETTEPMELDADGSAEPSRPARAATASATPAATRTGGGAGGAGGPGSTSGSEELPF